MPEPIFTRFADEFGIGTVSILAPGIVNPLDYAARSQLIQAAGAAVNALSSTGAIEERGLGNTLDAERAALAILGQPLGAFQLTADLTHGFVQDTIFNLPTRPGELNLDQLILFASAQGSNPEFNPSLTEFASALPNLSLSRRREQLVQRSNPLRNPFRSLQAGPFLPCSSDDPRGRCLSPEAREIRNAQVRKVAGPFRRKAIV